MTITIGSQTNVPDPGSPITSPWAQDTAKKIVHQFTDAAARDAWSAGLQDGALCTTRDTNKLFQYTGSAWSEVAQLGDVVAKTGSTMSGSLIVGSNPVAGTAGTVIRSDQLGAIHTRAHTLGTNEPNINLTRQASSNGVGHRFVSFVVNPGADTVIGTITIAGGSSVAYNTTSDRRLKDDLGPVVAGLQRVAALQPRHYAWKVDGAQADGFFADEVAQVAPYAVFGEPDALDADGNIEPQQLDPAKLVVLLVAAVQELTARVVALEGV